MTTKKQKQRNEKLPVDTCVMIWVGLSVIGWAAAFALGAWLLDLLD